MWILELTEWWLWIYAETEENGLALFSDPQQLSLCAPKMSPRLSI